MSIEYDLPVERSSSATAPGDPAADPRPASEPPAAPRARKPDRRRARTRAAITAAAGELFSAKGIQSTTIDEIAQAAGTSAGTVYFHFGSKEGIAAAAVEDAVDAVEFRLAEARQAPSALDRLLSSFEVYVRFAVDEPLAFQLLARDESRAPGAPDRPGGPNAVAMRVGTFLGRAAADVEQAIRDGELPEVSVDDAVNLIWATCSGLAALAVRNDDLRLDAAATERALELGRRTIRAGLGASPAR